ncbi:hypothetical protein CLOM_g2945 [Closterium sp. NIES-68]|nr:hypothetical protein CLOM_g2945 [Closterium sp. NIES-68]
MMMDPVLVLIIASCMTLTQFALQLKENITTSAYLKNFNLMLESTASLHALLTEFKSFKGWGVATDGAKKSFQRLEDLLRKATALLQRCISARSKLLQLVSEHALQAQDFIKMHAELEQCLSTVPIQTLPEPLTSKLTAMRQQLLNTPFSESVTPAMRAQLQLLLSSAASPSPALKEAPGSDVLAFQLAEALGLGLSAEAANPGALRREQEALALEKRKAQEGRDLAQAKVVEQIVLVLMRMDREVAARREKQKRAAEAASGAASSAGASSTAATSSSIFAPQPNRPQAAAAAPGINLLADSLTELSVGGNDRQAAAAASSQQQQQGAGAGPGADGNRVRHQEGQEAAKKAVEPLKMVLPGESAAAAAGFGAGTQPAKSPQPAAEAAGGGAAAVNGADGVAGAAAAARSRSPAPSAVAGSTASSAATRTTAAAPSSSAATAATTPAAATAQPRPAAAAAAAPAPAPAAAASGEQGVAQQIIRTLRLGTVDEKAQAAGLVGWHTKFSATNRAMFRSAGVIDALLPLAAASGPTEAKAADAAVRALGNLLADEDVKVELIGHLPLLVQALKRAELPASRAGMARIFKAIATISDEACKVVVDAGAVPHLAKFLDPSVAAAPANPPPTGGAAVAAAAAAEEASKQCSAETLAILAQVPSKRSRMVADGVVGPLSLLVLANPPTETLIAAVTALAGLASVHEGREGMGPALPTLVNLLRVEDEGVMAPALDALLLLAKHSAAYRSGIRNNGGMRHLRNVLRVGPSPLHNKGMELLAALFS